MPYSAGPDVTDVFPSVFWVYSVINNKIARRRTSIRRVAQRDFRRSYGRYFTGDPPPTNRLWCNARRRLAERKT